VKSGAGGAAPISTLVTVAITPVAGDAVLLKERLSDGESRKRRPRTGPAYRLAGYLMIDAPAPSRCLWTVLRYGQPKAPGAVRPP
jgi:hypothetical protein